MMTMADAEAAACAHMGGVHVEGVHVDSEWVIIRRIIAGLPAQVNVPTSSYRGVTLRSAGPGSDTSNGFEIALLHMDTNLDVILEACVDDTDLIASWRRYARDLALPLLIEDREGRLQPVQETAGRMGHARRGGSPLRHRRPRFLSRRQPGCPALTKPQMAKVQQV
jgi:Family of unknown function (DUF6101)